MSDTDFKVGLFIGAILGFCFAIIFLLIASSMMARENSHQEFCKEKGFDYAQNIFSGNNGVFYASDNTSYLNCCNGSKAVDGIIVPLTCVGIEWKP